MTLYEQANILCWQAGVSLLVERGVQERQARSCLGMWLRDAGAFKVLEALSKVEQNGTFDPVPYMNKATRAKGDGPPVRSAGDIDRDNAVMEAIRANDFAKARRIAAAQTVEEVERV